MKNLFSFPFVRTVVTVAVVSAAGSGCSKKPSVAMPVGESRFIGAVNSFVSQYGNAVNALQRSSLRSARMSQLAQVSGDRAITAWVGTIKEVTTAPNGDVAVAVQLPDSNIVLRTMTKSFADMSLKTMIPKDSPLHDRVTALTNGAMVKFDGTFLFGNDYLKELSSNDKDSLTKPEFLVQFKDISPKS